MAISEKQLFVSDVGRSSVFVYDRYTLELEQIVVGSLPASARFGRSIAATDQWLLIGAPRGPDGKASPGCVQVYRREATEWVATTVLTASDGDSDDRFGWSISIDRKTAVIGARDDETVSGDAQRGSAYVFTESDGRWAEQQKLVDPTGAAFDLFGASVSLSDDLLAVGAPGNSNPHLATGAVLIFGKKDAVWQFIVELNQPEPGASDLFGWSVDAASTRVLVGTPMREVGAGGDHGAAYLFEWSGGTWMHAETFVAPWPEPVAWFGRSVAFVGESGDAIVIGEPLRNLNTADVGTGYVFHNGSRSWLHVYAEHGPASSAEFGEEVRASHGSIAFGAPGSGSVTWALGLDVADCNANEVGDDCDIAMMTSDDRNCDAIPDECNADLDGSGVVDSGDIVVLLRSWGECSDECDRCAGDFDADCDVGFLDLLFLLSLF